MKPTVMLAILIIGSMVIVSQTSFGDDDHEENRSGVFTRTPGVEPVHNDLYKSECGACHFDYQPGLLPARSWSKIMAQLDDHFGDNAELDEADHQAIENYLKVNSADNSGYRRSKKIIRSLAITQSPVRITEVPYFIRKHDEIPSKLVKNNAKIGSLSQCDKCHQNASSGSFSERDISIPGYGKWDD